MRTENPLVSIILPTYNGERYLSQAIDSCINQTYRNIELIIVDDASTDSTPHIIEKFQKIDTRIRTITNKTNKKLPMSLNVGHRAAKGEYVTWTSDDNFYDSIAIEKLVESIIQVPTIDIVYTDYQKIDEDGDRIGLRKLESVYNLTKGNVIGACFLYSKKVFDVLNGYDTELYLAEDYDFWIRASGKFKFRHLNIAPYFYREHEGSLTNNNVIQIQKVTRQTQFRNLQIFKNYPLKYRKIVYSNLINFFYGEKDFYNVRKIYLHYLSLGPKPFLGIISLTYRKFIISFLPRM